MKLSHHIKLTLILLTVATLLLSAVPAQAKGPPPPPPVTADDTDQDGLLDSEEGANFSLPNGGSYDTDPARPDLFCSFPDSDYSWIPSETTLDLLAAPAGSGFDATVHYVDSTHYGTDRGVVMEDGTPRHRGVKMIESTNISVTFLGWCGNGTPNTEGAGECTIYTRKALDWIEEKCGNRYGTNNCWGCIGGDCNSNHVYGQDLLDALITWCVLHEFLHSHNCRAEYYRKYNGNHFAEGTLFIMDSIPYSYEIDGVVFFEIPDIVSAECFSGRLLY